MYGIAASSDRTRAFRSYCSNLDRGCYSSGYLGIGPGHFISQQVGVFTEPVKMDEDMKIFGKTQEVEEYFLYHSRGPTVETKGFIPENNHPFVYGDWIVAHNGVISNFPALCRKHYPHEDFTGKTDSCIIPRLIDKMGLKLALEELEGTFAIWAWKEGGRKVYLARSGSTLYFGSYTGDFSSTEFPDSKPALEGIIYEISLDNPLAILPQEKFKHKSPYFFLDDEVD